MKNRRNSQLEILVEKLDRELVARDAQIPGERRIKSADRKGTPDVFVSPNSLNIVDKRYDVCLKEVNKWRKK
jgi:hypothetical protein